MSIAVGSLPTTLNMDDANILQHSDWRLGKLHVMITLKLYKVTLFDGC